MRWPWVSRLAHDLILQERDWLRSEVDRLSDEAKRLTDAVMQNARLVPVFETAPNRKPVKAPKWVSAERLARQLERKERA